MENNHLVQTFNPFYDFFNSKENNHKKSMTQKIGGFVKARYCFYQSKKTTPECKPSFCSKKKSLWRCMVELGFSFMTCFSSSPIPWMRLLENL